MSGDCTEARRRALECAERIARRERENWRDCAVIYEGIGDKDGLHACRCAAAACGNILERIEDEIVDAVAAELPEATRAELRAALEHGIKGVEA